MRILNHEAATKDRFRGRTWCGALLGLLLCYSCKSEVAVYVSPSADPVEKLAAKELTESLSKVYRNNRFVCREAEAPQADGIYIGTGQSMAPLAEAVGVDTAKVEHDGYIVKNLQGKCLIYGRNRQGVANGTYGLLSALGYGHYIHRDALPAPSKEPLDLKSLPDLQSNPVVAQRVNFAWHNFLSGCTSWNLPDWQHWIDQSQKAGFNAIMLHSYGNSPMAAFGYNGKQKWTGRMAGSKKGREWRIQHCDDIRKAIGGNLFDGPNFGSSASESSDEEHLAAVANLTNGIYSHASARGMETIMSIDVDTEPALSQEILRTLPPHARIETEIPTVAFLNQQGGTFYLPNTDTPEGYGFCRAQVEALLKAYPTLDNICLWVRIQATPLMGLQKERLPEAWKQEYEAKVKEKPEAEKYWRSAGIFALGKMADAFKRAAAELKPSLTISVGTWFKYFLPAADYFIAPDVAFIFLDYPYAKRVMVAEEGPMEQLKQIAAHRKVTPIYWGQEDNGYYYGNTLRAVEQLGSRSREAGVEGFGIIQWLHKPTELFVSHMNRQLWSDKLDESQEASVADYVARHFNESIQKEMNLYFNRWMEEGIAVGRESGVRFITDRFRQTDALQEAIAGRAQLLEEALKGAERESEKELINYHLHMERFIGRVLEVERHFFRAQDLIIKGDLEGAREETRLCDIEEVISSYADYIGYHGITREELGLLVTMNLRWYPSYVQLRATLGLDDLRLNFAHTDYEPLVHEPGWSTFLFDDEHRLWETFGTAETGGAEWQRTGNLKSDVNLPKGYAEVMQTGMQLSDTTRLIIRPNPHGEHFAIPLASDYLCAGRYELNLYVTADEAAALELAIATREVQTRERPTKQGQQAVVVQEPRAERLIYEEQPARQCHAGVERLEPNTALRCLTYTIDLTTLGSIDLQIVPTEGRPVICAAVLKKEQAKN